MDTGTGLPGAAGNFAEFNNFAVSNGRVVIEGFDFNFGGQQGVYTNLCGVLAPVLVRRAMVEGKPSQGVLPSGQVTGLIDDRPSCAELIESVMEEAERTLKGLSN